MAFDLHLHLCLLITAITVSVASSLVLLAYLKRKINTPAFIGTLILGVLILLMLGLEFGYAGLLALLAFFILGNLVTRYKYEEKALLGVAESNKGMRDISNVLGNGLSPLIFAVLYALSSQNQDYSHNTLFLLGFAGSVATACADTFSTEIGQTSGEPRLITTLKKVPVGTNGGVSLAGLGAALLGSSLISVVCLVFVFAGSNASVQIGVIFFIVCVLAGVLGCIADSIFGATIEDKYKDKLFVNLNKHHVNILATLTGGIIAILLGYSFGVQI